MRLFTRISIAGALAALLSAHLALPEQKEQQQQRPKFNVQVNLVSLDVEVLDQPGNPIPGLTRNDFVVKENGRTMEITNFAWLADRPVSLAMVLDTSAISS